METVDLVMKVLAGLTGIAGVFIAWFIFRLSQQQRKDSWSRSFSELHHAFWSDKDFREVRSWIANDESYTELDRVLEKRFSGRDQVSKDDYGSLEKVDKFFNFFLRAYDVSTRMHGRGTSRWEKLFFQYWMDDIVKAERYRLWVYFKDFYEANDAYLPITVDGEELQRFQLQALEIATPK